jgi:hypothetical protein
MSEANMPRVGDQVYYYGGGNSAVPCAATVVAVFGSADLVNLAVWEVNRFVPKDAIMRHGCQAVVNSPTIAQQRGTWDYRDPPEIRNAISDLVGKKPAKSKE